MEDNMEVNLKLLIDMLDKKNEVLTEIYNITTNQNSILSSEVIDMAMFDSTANMVKEKTDYINDLDDRFQEKYDLISKNLSDNVGEYAEYISLLKDKIRIATEMKMKIKLKEEANREKIEQIK